MTQNPMVPNVNWGEVAQGFDENARQGRQVILCSTCVLDIGMTSPPAQIVILGGQSYCLDHLPRGTA